ncbi:PRA1 family protein B4 [Glycine soja]|uniref:PRA1 family protein n=1 Tax=Glycine soja TaxID=3848 RepID=A0A445IJJ1_GLYSO|nr:PRA1 family protein B4 [Glycine soja]
MSSTAPPVLPISNPQTTARTTSAGGGAIKAPANNLTFCAFINNLSTSLHHGLDQCRHWSELADRSTFSKPESSKATLRVRKNFSYFHTNYYVVVSLILAVSLLTVNIALTNKVLLQDFCKIKSCLKTKGFKVIQGSVIEPICPTLTNHFSLILHIGLLASWTFLYLFRPSDQPLVILSRTFSDFETLALLSTFTVFVFFLTSVRSVLILILMLDAAVIFLHNAFCMSEDLFLDDQENSQAIGFLSFLHRCRHRRHRRHHSHH